jgi:hypothetical protein
MWTSISRSITELIRVSSAWADIEPALPAPCQPPASPSTRASPPPERMNSPLENREVHLRGLPVPHAVGGSPEQGFPSRSSRTAWHPSVTDQSAQADFVWLLPRIHSPLPARASPSQPCQPGHEGQPAHEGGSRAGANEFAAGKSRSPPSWTARAARRPGAPEQGLPSRSARSTRHPHPTGPVGAGRHHVFVAAISIAGAGCRPPFIPSRLSPYFRTSVLSHFRTAVTPPAAPLPVS